MVGRRDAGLPETYFAQYYSVRAVEQQISSFDSVTVIVCLTNQSYDVVEKNGLRSIGLGLSHSFSDDEVINALKTVNPTHIIFRTVQRNAMSWAAREGKEIICILAESITNVGWRSRLRNLRLGWILRSKKIRWVGAYGVASAKAYAAYGVSASKIVPWDFFHTEPTQTFPAKTLSEPGSGKVLFVGSMSMEKGVDDLVAAFAILGNSHPGMSLTLVGKDENDRIARLLASGPNNFEHTQIPFVPNHLLEEFMSEFSVIVVPSRHSYPEGLPLVLTHAMMAKVPVVSSDHPMLMSVLRHKENAMIFPQGQSKALAGCISELLGNADLYSRLSQSSDESFKKMALPVKFHHLCDYGFERGTPGEDWLRSNTLKTLHD